MNTGSIIASSVSAAVFTQAVPTSSDWTGLGFSVLSAVLAAVLSWLSGRRPAA